MKYSELDNMQQENKSRLTSIFIDIINNLKDLSFRKAVSIINYIPQLCIIHHNSRQNRLLKRQNTNKLHPLRPIRGEIYNAMITENIGSELCGNHLVVIVQNYKGNLYGEKVNVLPIEGDGNKINPNYQIQLSNSDLESGELDKNPSRIIVTDIMTMDKARLDNRIGKIKVEKMYKIDEMIINQLELNNYIDKYIKQ